MLLDTKIDKLQERKSELQEQIKAYKKSLQQISKELKDLEETKAVFQAEENLETTVTKQDLYDMVEKLKTDHPKNEWILTLHDTPLKPEEQEFYQQTIDIKGLCSRYRLVVDLYYDYSKIESATIDAMSSSDGYQRETTILRYDPDKEDCKISFDQLLDKYIELRNKYINNDTMPKDSLIPIDTYYEAKKSRARVSKYLAVIRQKDDLCLLDEFAQQNSLNICGYYQALNVLNKEQLHELATVIRENKEQVFRWMLSFKWKNQMKPKVEFDMTPVFKMFKKYNVPFRTARGCSGYGKHHWCEFTLDGRMYEVER